MCRVNHGMCAMNKARRARFLAFALLPAMLISCATVPVTGRRSLNLVSDTELARLSLDSYRKVIDEAELSSDPAQLEMVRRVGGRIARATESYLRAHDLPYDQFVWEFNVIKDDDQVNAWAMPGGKIAVYTGIFPVARDDAGLAAVLGHEIAHVLARHGNERMSRALLVELGGQTLSAAMSQRPGWTSNLLLASYGAGSQVGVILPHSRLQESEADRIGLTLMAIAGYDPRAAIGLWERMAGSGGSRPPRFLSTHPRPESRIQDIQRYLPEAMAIYEGQ